MQPWDVLRQVARKVQRSQSPYGAQSLATSGGTRQHLAGTIRGSQSPYGAQSLATPKLIHSLRLSQVSSQSPYGAQSLATRMTRTAAKEVLMGASQSPYGAQSLATHARGRSYGAPAGWGRNPLTGLNPLQHPACPCARHKPRCRRNPLTGLNPLQPIWLFAIIRIFMSQSPYGAQSLATAF